MVGRKDFPIILVEVSLDFQNSIHRVSDPTVLIFSRSPSKSRAVAIFTWQSLTLVYAQSSALLQVASRAIGSSDTEILVNEEGFCGCTRLLHCPRLQVRY